MHHDLIPGSATIAILVTLMAEGTTHRSDARRSERGAAEWYPTPLR